MARARPLQSETAPIASHDSDYGSDLDLDDATLDSLFFHATSATATAALESNPSTNTSFTFPGVVEAPVIVEDDGDRRPLARLARIRANLSAAIAGLDSTCDALAAQAGPRREAAVEVEYDEGNRAAFSPSRSGSHEQQQQQQQQQEQPQATSSEPERPDTRTPLQRFRSKKPLSVTDLVSPAWCELQYWYNLTKFGRVRRTPAMKQGSSVHKVLEEQVYTTVPVDTVTKEDRFALRIWNVIQGLRTLRRTGMTRELEVWGVVDGEVVNGVIDEITTHCPDEAMEAQLLEAAEGAHGSETGKGKRKALPADQRTLTAYMTASPSTSILEQHHESSRANGWLGTLHIAPTPLYIVDIKTRQSQTLPPLGSQTRPTHYQLMLYHRLFAALSANTVPAASIFTRYGVEASATFSDTFIAQIGSLNVGFEPRSTTDDEDPNEDSDPISELLAHSTLTALWTLMIRELSRAAPPNSLSPLLTAEFRTATDGTLIGRRSFAFDAPPLEAYARSEVQWWRGEREARGVEVEEAFKCRMCEFAAGCSWRATKVEEGVRKARLRQEARRLSRV